jgi:hypothetical protein
MNFPIPDLLGAESYGQMVNFRAHWQTVVETQSGHALQKLRLELAPSVSEALTHLNA